MTPNDLIETLAKALQAMVLSCAEHKCGLRCADEALAAADAWSKAQARKEAHAFLCRDPELFAVVADSDPICSCGDGPSPGEPIINGKCWVCRSVQPAPCVIHEWPVGDGPCMQCGTEQVEHAADCDLMKSGFMGDYGVGCCTCGAEKAAEHVPNCRCDTDSEGPNHYQDPRCGAAKAEVK